MALTYAQLDALTINATFLGRVRSAIAGQAAFYVAQGAGATQAQKNWAAQVFTNIRCSQIAANLMRQLCEDPAITGSSVGDGTDVTDAQILAAVAAICLNYF